MAMAPTGGAGHTGGAQTGSADLQGAASLQGGSADASPTKTPLQYRLLAIATWNVQTLYASLT